MNLELKDTDEVKYLIKLIEDKIKKEKKLVDKVKSEESKDYKNYLIERLTNIQFRLKALINY